MSCDTCEHHNNDYEFSPCGPCSNYSYALYSAIPSAEEALAHIINSYDNNSGYEPSLSVFQQAIDEGRDVIKQLKERKL